MRIRQLEPGDHEVDHRGGRTRVLVPAGVGVPGVAEDDLVELLVTILGERGRELPAVVDVSHLLGADPTLFDEIARRAEEES